MQTLRIRFEKRGRARFISHLDLNRCMSRALRRAKIPVWYTQGFNPHPYITFALPLSLFFESTCETMDLRLEGDMMPDEIKERLNGQMPEGLCVQDVFEPRMQAKEIVSASYSVVLEYPELSAAEIKQMWEGLLACPALPVEKKSKRGMREIDMKPFFTQAETEMADGVLSLRVLLPAGQQETVNPSYFNAAVLRHAGREAYLDPICRTGVFNAEGEPFA